MTVGSVGAVGSLSRVNLAMATMRASATRRANMQASATATTARNYTRRPLGNLQRAEFTARPRAAGAASPPSDESVDTYA